MRHLKGTALSPECLRPRGQGEATWTYTGPVSLPRTGQLLCSPFFFFSPASSKHSMWLDECLTVTPVPDLPVLWVVERGLADLTSEGAGDCHSHCPLEYFISH